MASPSGLTPKQQRFVDEYLIDSTLIGRSIDRSGGFNACWPWRAATDEDGYGRVRYRGRSVLAHRLAFSLSHDAPAPEAVCHFCDNPPCCNPEHLFGGTRAINNADMIAKGRYGARPPKGSRHGHAKLSEDHAVEIRALYAVGDTTQRKLAVRFGVSQRTIAKVVTRTGWTHV